MAYVYLASNTCAQYTHTFTYTDNRPQDVSEGSLGDPRAAAKENLTVVEQVVVVSRSELPSGSEDPQALSEYLHRKNQSKQFRGILSKDLPLSG